jgi:hypothetical protein
VLRGGSWNNNARNARAAYRNNNQPDNANDNIGFRVVLLSAAHNSTARPVNPLAGATLGRRQRTVPKSFELARSVPG